VRERQSLASATLAKWAARFADFDKIQLSRRRHLEQLPSGSHLETPQRRRPSGGLFVGGNLHAHVWPSGAKQWQQIDSSDELLQLLPLLLLLRSLQVIRRRVWGLATPPSATQRQGRPLGELTHGHVWPRAPFAHTMGCIHTVSAFSDAFQLHSLHANDTAFQQASRPPNSRPKTRHWPLWRRPEAAQLAFLARCGPK